MTEADWLTCTKALPMVEFLASNIPQRKLRLFVCGCCRLQEALLVYEDSREALDLVERYADELVDLAELRRARLLAGSFGGKVPANIDAIMADPGIMTSIGVYYATNEEMTPLGIRLALFGLDQGRSAQGGSEKTGHPREGDIFRDVCGNPFRPARFDPSWRTPITRSMARVTYQERRFEDMPILGDALEDAGCDDADILDHCRQTTPHIRGCWVLDGLLELA